MDEKVGITTQDFDRIKQAFKPKFIPKKTFLLRAGEISKYLAFVTSGALRLFKIDEKGEEHILQFAIENWWISDRESFSTSTPSDYFIDAIQDTQVLVMDYQQSQLLEQESIPYRTMVSRIKEVNAIAQQKRLVSSLTFTAREKYAAFMDRYPEINARFPQRMIASYLGIQPETLSRLRKELL